MNAIPNLSAIRAVTTQDNNLVNHDVEMYLIATALAYPARWHELSHVKAADFNDPLSAKVWQAIGDLIIAGRQPNANIIAMEIYKSAEDQRALTGMLSDWMGSTLTHLSGTDYANTILDLSQRRQIFAAATEIASLAKDTTCGLNASEISSQGIASFMQPHLECTDFEPAHTIGDKVIGNLDKALPVTKTGFARLDKALGGGFYQGRYYGLGARMKSGKSLFMGTLAYNMAMAGSRILYLCLEMGAEESMQRILSIHMGVNSLDFMRPEIRNQEWFRGRLKSANDALKTKKLYFRSKPRMTLDDLKSTIARAGMSGKVDGVIVDYLQLVEGKSKGQSSAEHYDNVAQTLAEAVKRHPMWILSAAQLNKEGNVRGSEGLLMACDLAFALNKIEGKIINTEHGERKQPDRAWLETMVSRYTPYMDIGSQENAGYEICLDRGPSFIEFTA